MPNPKTRSADWHLSFFLKANVSYDEIFGRAWGVRVGGDSFVTAIGYYVSSMRIQTGHALIQLSRDVTRAEIESYLNNCAIGAYCLLPVSGHVMPARLVEKLEHSHGTFATFSVKELYA